MTSLMHQALLPPWSRRWRGADTITLAGTNDVAQAGKGDDTINLALTGGSVNTVYGGEGKDSITLGTAVSVFSGYAQANTGNDVIDFNGRTVSAATVGGNAGNDTITATANTTLSYLGGGQGNDLIDWSGAGSNTTVKGGKGKDTISIVGAAGTSTILGNEGFDTISATALTANTTVYIGGGKGGDSISLAAQLGTVVGGYLADTITARGAFGGGLIYGDKLNESVGGDGTDSLADGNDLMSFTAGILAEGTTIYGAGGNDTVKFINGSAAASALLVDTGKGADFIGHSTTNFFSIVGHGTLNGGSGHDTIKFNQALSGIILGGAGADSIFGVAVTGGGSIDGGAGNDTLNFTNGTTFGSQLTLMTTIDAGAGSDSIILATYTAITSTRAGVISGSFMGIVDGVSAGDVIRLTNNQAVAATANWLGQTQIYVGANAAGVTSAVASGNGSIAVYASGNDMVVGIMAGLNQSTWAKFVVKDGAGHIKTTLTAQDVTMSSSNFGFSVGSTNNNVGLTFA